MIDLEKTHIIILHIFIFYIVFSSVYFLINNFLVD